MWDQMDGKIAGDSDTEVDARGCTPIKHQTFFFPIRSQIPTAWATQPQWPLSAWSCETWLSSRAVSVPPRLGWVPLSNCIPLIRHRLEPHAAVSGSARQTLPGSRKEPRLLCHQHFKQPRIAGLTPWPTHIRPAETSQYKSRRTPASSLGRRCPNHRTT